MFKIYNLVCYFKKHPGRSEWFNDLDAALKHIDEYDYWFVELNEIIDGLYYPVKIVARSSYVV